MTGRVADTFPAAGTLAARPDVPAAGGPYFYAAEDAGVVYRCMGGDPDWSVWAVGVPQGTTDGDVPVWDAATGLYVPQAVAGGGASVAADVAFTPTGLLASTDVQAALAELDSEVATRITAAIDALVAGAPGALDTLNEIAAQLSTDESAHAALVTSVAGKIAASVVDAKGDLIVGTADNTVARRAVGSDGQVLTADSAQSDGVKWAPPPGVPATLIDAKGDLLVGTADNTAARRAVGSNGQVLTADSTQVDGVKWAPPPSGGLTQAYVGRNAIGASLEVMTNNRIYTKKITLANDCLITDIQAYLDAQSNVWGIAVGLYADNAGAPGKLRSANAHPVSSIYPADAGWFGMPLGMWATAGDWWLAVQFRGASTTSPFQIAYDTGGNDPATTAAGAWLPELTPTTMTDSTRNYSIRANTVR